MEHIDYNGIAVLIGAVVAGIISLGGFVLNVLTYRRQAKLQQTQSAGMDAANRRENKLDKIAVQVNGITEKAVNLAYEKGKAETLATIATVAPHKVTPP